MSKLKLKPEEIAEILKKNVDEKRMVDISSGVEELFDVGKPRFKAAVDILRNQSYQVLLKSMTQSGDNGRTIVKVLAAPKVHYKDLFDHKIYPVEVK